MHSKKMDFDAILPKLGGFGKWQILTTTLCSLCAVGGGIITMTYSFTGKMQLFEKKFVIRVIGKNNLRFHG